MTLFDGLCLAAGLACLGLAWRALPVGPRSVLAGAHCFFVHPWFVAAAWARCYGFPWDPRLWAAFFAHDLGYLFFWCGDMDGADGERHPEWAARLMHALFDGPGGPDERRDVAGEDVHDPGRFDDLWGQGWRPVTETGRLQGGRFVMTFRRPGRSTYWHDLVLYHSRFYAKRDGRPYSRLCVADKLAVALEPWWLYLPRVWLTGELYEYMALSRAAALGKAGEPGSKYRGEPQCTTAAEVAGLGPYRAWFVVMTNYCRKWAVTHAGGAADTWTLAPAPLGQEARA